MAYPDRHAQRIAARLRSRLQRRPTHARWDVVCALITRWHDAQRSGASGRAVTLTPGGDWTLDAQMAERLGREL